jgi:HK97 family phage portal protein
MTLWESAGNNIRNYLFGSEARNFAYPDHHHAFNLRTFEDIHDGDVDTTVPVTYSNAMGISAVYSCVKVISEDISVMDIGVEEFKGGYWVPAPDHYLNEFFRNPSAYQSWMDISGVTVGNGALSGNGFGLIHRDSDGRPQEMELKEFQEVGILETQDRKKIIYQVTTASGESKLYYPWEIFHLKGFSLNGRAGISPIMQHKSGLSISLQSTKYANETYAHGGYGGGIITHPGDLSATARSKISGGVRKTQASRQYPVLDEGMKFTPNRMSPSDIDYINQERFSASKVNALYRVAKHLTMLDENGSKASTEDDSLNHMNRCLLPWVKRMESEMEQKFLTRDQRRNTRIVYNLDSFHRASTSTRLEWMKGMALMQLKTINELRALNGDGPVPDGNRFVDFQKSKVVDQIGQQSKEKNSEDEG